MQVELHPLLPFRLVLADGPRPLRDAGGFDLQLPLVGADPALDHKALPLPDGPGQLLTFSPGLELEVAGQRASALRGALWEEEGTQVLYLYLRMDTWKFWTLGILKEEWMTVTDDRGNRYGLGLEGPQDQNGGLLSSLSGGAGKGPFHRGYTLRVWGVDPEAETIYLNYGPGEPVFSFPVDLEEGAA